MKMARLVVSGVLLFGCAMSAMGAAEVTIGTGSSSGIYYQAGRAICRLVNADTDDHGIICAPKTSPGSINNLEQIRDGELEIGLAQSDWQYHAYKGSCKVRCGRSRHQSALPVLPARRAVHGRGACRFRDQEHSTICAENASTSAIRARASMPPWRWSWPPRAGTRVCSPWPMNCLRRSRQWRSARTGYRP